MLIAVIVVLTVLFWGGMLVVYYRPELRRWLDNRFGPERVTKEEEEEQKARTERKMARWRWYG